MYGILIPNMTFIAYARILGSKILAEKISYGIGIMLCMF